MSKREDTDLSNLQAVGCGWLLGIVILIGLIGSIVQTVFPDRGMERCIESCGPDRDVSYTRSSCTCSTRDD